MVDGRDVEQERRGNLINLTPSKLAADGDDWAEKMKKTLGLLRTLTKRLKHLPVLGLILNASRI